MSSKQRPQPELSVILPGIRKHNWLSFYKSIEHSFHKNFELIIISPYELPVELKKYNNIKHIFDHGSPARCQQIGLVNCSGRFITWGADDGIFLENKLEL